MGAQLVQANVQAYFSFGSGKGMGKRQRQIEGRKYLVRTSHMSLGDSPPRLKDLKANTECFACGRWWHWANDRECTMSSLAPSSQNGTRTAPDDRARTTFFTKTTGEGDLGFARGPDVE